MSLDDGLHGSIPSRTSVRSLPRRTYRWSRLHSRWDVLP